MNEKRFAMCNDGSVSLLLEYCVYNILNVGHNAQYSNCNIVYTGGIPPTQ